MSRRTADGVVYINVAPITNVDNYTIMVLKLHVKYYYVRTTCRSHNPITNPTIKLAW